MIIEYIKQRATLFMFMAGVAATLAFGYWAYDKGKLVERAEWVQKENKELDAKNQALVEQQAEILKLQGERDKAMGDLAEATANRGTQLQEELVQNDQQTEATIAKLLADNQRLRGDLRVSEANAATAGLAATVLGSYAAGQARLSDEAVRFFGREAGRCNAVVKTLTACQDTLRIWRSKVGEYNQQYFSPEAKK